MIYQCEVKDIARGTSESYIGLTGNTFKDRYYKHTRSFRVQRYHTNSLSSHIWDLKRRGVNFVLSWKIVAKSKSYSPNSKACALCTKEICYIMYEKELSTLNKRSEFFNHCLHKQKFLLQNQ